MNAKEIEQEITEDAYEEVLNDIYGVVEICGMRFDSGRALKELDPVAFRCGKVEYEDGLERKWECGECSTEFDDETEAEECCQPTTDDVVLQDDGTTDTVVSIKGKTYRYSDTSEYRDAATGAFTVEGWREFVDMALEDYLNDSEGK